MRYLIFAILFRPLLQSQLGADIDHHLQALAYILVGISEKQSDIRLVNQNL